MKWRQFRWAAAIVVIAGLVPPGVTTDRGSELDARPAASSCYVFARKDKALFRKINRERVDRDLSPLKLDPELSQVARKHTQRMIEKNLIFHDTATNAGRTTKWVAFGENVGAGQTVDEQHQEYMNSEDHRKNILKSDMTHAGIAVKTSSATGRLFTTELFTRVENPGTTLGAPKC